MCADSLRLGRSGEAAQLQLVGSNIHEIGWFQHISNYYAGY